MSRMVSRAVIKRKLLILTLVALIVFVLVIQGCTCGCAATEWWPLIISDNSGGAIVAYGIYEKGDRNAYIQRIDAEGNRLWGEKGVLLSSASPPDWLRSGQMIADGSGGAIIVWKQSDGVVAQKFDSGGHIEWRKDNVPVTGYLRVVSDGSGGAIIASSFYSKERKGNVLHVLRIDSEGDLLWTENDAPISLGLRDDGFEMASDNLGGAVIVWEKRSADIFVQRIDSGGDILWEEGGLGVSTSGSYNPQMTGDGSGGAIVVWKQVEENDEGRKIRSIYAQRVDAEGNILWRQGGLPVLNIPEKLVDFPNIVSDESNGAIIVSMTSMNLNAQRIDSDGNIQWARDGVKVQGSEGPQSSSFCVIADGSGGAIIAFERRSGSVREPVGLCYVQKLDATGRNQWLPDGTLVSTEKSLPIISNDSSGGAVTVCWPYVQKINAQGERMWGEQGVLLSRGDIF